jgi:hypothetical protein
MLRIGELSFERRTSAPPVRLDRDADVLAYHRAAKFELGAGHA